MWKAEFFGTTLADTAIGLSLVRYYTIYSYRETKVAYYFTRAETVNYLWFLMQQM